MQEFFIVRKNCTETYKNYFAGVEAAGRKLHLADRPEDLPKAGILLLPGGGDVAPGRYNAAPIPETKTDAQADRVEFEALRFAAAHNMPVFGICRGLQVLNVFFGGSLLQDIPGHSKNPRGQDGVHETYAENVLLQKLYGRHFSVNSAHHQTIDRLGEDLMAIQWSKDGIIEGICHKTLPIFAVQWHPERTQYSPGSVDGAKLLAAISE